jgi:hypothetical protein
VRDEEMESMQKRPKTEPRPAGSAKGAACTSKQIRNWPAPRSVLRKFLRSATPNAEPAPERHRLPYGRGSVTPSKGSTFMSRTLDLEIQRTICFDRLRGGN